MDIEQLRDHCISKKGVEECFPFNETTLVFKVMGKMFLLADIDSKPFEFNVKCDPEFAIELRENHSCVKPGFHMSKTHWNTITCDNSVPQNQLKKWMDHSYDEVVKGLTKKLRLELESL